MTVRVVAFDLMDTVVRDPFRDALEAATGHTLAELFERRDPSAFPAFERGELDEDAYWAHYADAGIDIDPATFHRVRLEGTRWLPGMAELLDDLAGHLVRATASNYPVWVEQLAAGPLAGRFERVVASCHLGARKPDPAFYTRLLASLGEPADAVAFVDDRADNVEAARAAGIDAVRFTGADDLRAWLTDRGVAAARAA